MQASLSLGIKQFSLRIEVVYSQDRDRAPLKLAEAEREPVLDADAAGSHFRLPKRLRTCLNQASTSNSWSCLARATLTSSSSSTASIKVGVMA